MTPRATGRKVASHPRGARLWIALALGAGSFVLYRATLAPGLYWGDSAQLQLAVAEPTFALDARSYSIWSGLAALLRRIGGLDPAFAGNLFSAVSGALAVPACFLAGRALGIGRGGAVFAAIALAVAHQHWSASVVAEVYSLTALLVCLQVLATVGAVEKPRAGPFLFGLLFVVSTLHHRMLLVSGVLLGGVAILSWSRRSRLVPATGLAALGVLVGLVPIFSVGVLFYPDSATTSGVRSFLLGSFDTKLPSGLGFGSGLAGLVAYEVRFLFFNLFGPALALAAWGSLRLFSLGLRAPLALIALLVAGLVQPVLFPHIGDRYVLLLPAVVALALLAGATLSRIAPSRKAWLALSTLALAVPTASYALIGQTDLPRSFGLFRGATPEHVRSFAWPGKSGETRPEEWGLRVLSAVPPDAVLVTGWGEGAVLEYLRSARGLRADVRILHAPLDPGLAAQRELAPGRPFYRTSYPLIPDPPADTPGIAYLEVIPGSLWECVFRE